MKTGSFGYFILFNLIIISSFHFQNFNKANYIIPDFQVNENAGCKYSSQNNPKIAADCEGNFVVVWEDDRNAKDEIYFQYFTNELVPVQSNIKVFDNTASSKSDKYPDIIMLPDERFIIFWISDNYPKYELCLNHFSKDLVQLGNTVKHEISNPYFPLKKVIDGSGNFLIAWLEENPSGIIQLLTQRFSSDLSLIGVPMILKTKEENINLHVFSLASNYTGNLILVWKEWSDVEPKVYFQRFTNLGEKIGEAVNVIDTDVYNTNPDDVEIAADSIGNFVVSWIDHRNSPNSIDVYAQRCTSEGEKVGKNFKITTTNSGYISSLSMTYSKSKNYLLSWSHNKGYLKDNAWFQRLDQDGVKTGNNVMINNFQDSIQAFTPVMESDCYGNLYAAWIKNEYVNNCSKSGIYCRKFNTNNEAVSNEIIINDDDGNPVSEQYSPNINVNDNGDFIIGWLDFRNDIKDIYAQRFLNNGSFIGKNFKVNSSINSINSSPIIAFTPDSHFMLTWNQNDREKNQIAAQFYNSNGNAIDSNIIITEEPLGNGNIISDVVSTGLSNYIFVSQVNIDSSNSSKIYYQLFSENGISISEKKVIDDDPNFGYQHNPSISVFPNNDFIISWLTYNEKNYSATLLAQRYSSEGNKLGDKYMIEPADNSSYIIGNKVSVNLDGSFSLFWTEQKYENIYLKLQKYSSYGSMEDSIISIKMNEHIFEPNAVDENGNFIILERSDSNYPYFSYNAQRYDNSGSKIDTSFNLMNHNSNSATGFKVKIRNGRIYSTWFEKQSDNDYDIWANVLDWNNPTSIEELFSSKLPTSFELFQNYPNPFNPSTKIKYIIPEEVKSEKSNVKNVVLKVFDILGRVVAILVNQKQRPGNYEVEFNSHSSESRNLTSGVYFYKLTVGDFTETKKMVLLK